MVLSTTAPIVKGAMSVSTKRSIALAGFLMVPSNPGMTGIGAVPTEKLNEHTRTKHDRPNKQDRPIPARQVV